MSDTLKIDTIIVGVYDSSLIINEQQASKQIIIVQDKKSTPEKEWYENIWISSLLIPLIVAAGATWITYLINRKKTKKEVDKITQETEQIKKSFQPVVVGTIQSVQNNLIQTKIDAVKELTRIKSEFDKGEQRYHEGEPVDDYEYYLKSLFLNYSEIKFKALKEYKNQYSYFFSKNSFKQFNLLFDALESYNGSRISFYTVEEDEVDPRMNDDTRKILSLFDNVLNELRNELHLNNTFIQDFINSNKVDSDELQNPKA